ncbi:hypothetical protein F4779DRAFT_10137 [Xylariaceae sp. FL0662B]|nr:hypothetical protein F4779DRAFT_10137 [Xylariaceae sp. FL0662B]
MLIFLPSPPFDFSSNHHHTFLQSHCRRLRDEALAAPLFRHEPVACATPGGGSTGRERGAWHPHHHYHNNKGRVRGGSSVGRSSAFSCTILNGNPGAVFCGRGKIRGRGRDGWLGCARPSVGVSVFCPRWYGRGLRVRRLFAVCLPNVFLCILFLVSCSKRAAAW